MSQADRFGEIPGYELEEPPIYERRSGNVIWRARQKSLGRYVAVKQVHPSASDAERRREQLSQEARILANLAHPNIVPIYDRMTDAQGNVFYSMKIITQSPWSHVMRQRNLDENLDVLLKVMDAVAFAHSQEVCHLDLKPQNVMLGEFGEVLLMDWGISKWEGSEAMDDSRGTPEYAAPEMAQGLFDQMGPRSDTYLLGAILFEILAGVPPHDVSHAGYKFLPAAKNTLRPFPADAPPELQAIAMKAMETSPGDRYADVREMRSALRRYQEHHESNSLAADANRALAEARQTHKDELYGKARFLFLGALDRWDGNPTAAAGLLETMRAHAETALARGDLNLTQTLLSGHAEQLRAFARAMQDEQAPEAVGNVLSFRVGYDEEDQAREILQEKLDAALEEREAADRRAKAARKWVRRLVAAVVVISATAAVVSNSFRMESKISEAKAKDSEAKAWESEAKAEKSEAEAKESEANAKESEKKAKNNAYFALVRAAAAKTDELENENNFKDADKLLKQCDASLRQWEWGRLSYLCDLTAKSMQAPTPLSAVAATESGNWLALAGQNGKVSFWKQDRRIERSIDGASIVYAAAFSPDGKWLVTADNDGEKNQVKVWDAAKEELVRGETPRVHRSPVTCLAFSGDGTKLVSGALAEKDDVGQVGKAVVWDFDRQHGQLHHPTVLTGHWGTIHAVCFAEPPGAKSPDTIITAAEDGKLSVWTDKSGAWTEGEFSYSKSKLEIPSQHKAIHAIAYLKNENLLATGGDDGRIRLWNVTAIRNSRTQDPSKRTPVEPLATLAGHAGPVRCLAFLPPGKTFGNCLISGGDDNVLNVWDLASQKVRKPLRGHSGPILACCVCTKNGRPWVLSGSADTTAKLWDVGEHSEKQIFSARVEHGGEDAVLAGAFSSDGKRFVVGDLGRKAVLRNVTDTPETSDTRVEFKEGHEYLVERVLPSRDEKRLVTSARDGTVRLWDYAKGSQQCVQTNGNSTVVALSDSGRWLAVSGTVPDAAFPDRSCPAAVLWDVSAGPKGIQDPLGHKPCFRSPSGDVTALAISHDENSLFLGDVNGRCRLFDRASGERRWGDKPEHRFHLRAVTAAAFLPGDRSVLTASTEKAIVRWDVATGQPSAGFLHDEPVSAMVVSRDGERLVTASEDATVRIWSVGDGKELVRFPVSGGEKTLRTNLARLSVLKKVRFVDLARNSRVGEATLAGILWKKARGSPEDVRRLAEALEVSPEALWKPRVSCVAMSADRRRLLAVNATDAVVLVGDLDDSDRPTRWTQVRLPDDAEIWSAAFCTNATRNEILIAGGNAARLWDVEKNCEIRRFAPHDAVASACIEPNPPGQSTQTDRVRIATAGSDGCVKIWEEQPAGAAGGQGSSFQLDKLWGRIRRVVFSGDGRQLLIAGAGSPEKKGQAMLWSLAENRAEPIAEFVGKGGEVNDAVFCRIGGRDCAATVGNDNSIRFWKWETGRIGQQQPEAASCLRDGRDPKKSEIAADQAHAQAVLCVAFFPLTMSQQTKEDTPIRLPHGLLLTGSEDHTARLWQITTESRPAGESQIVLELLAELAGHTDAVTSVGFSPDGKRMITGSKDRTARIWAWDESERTAGKLPEARELLVLRGHTQTITSVAFSPKSSASGENYVLTTSRDGTAILWPASTPPRTPSADVGTPEAPRPPLPSTENAARAASPPSSGTPR